MVVAEYQRKARRRWRTKLRASGRSWICILAHHELCSGRFGRLVSMRDGDTRAPCTCPCHGTEAA